jgi:hypothetical protein
MLYGGRCANKQSGNKTVQKNIPGIGNVRLVLENESGTMYKTYKMFSLDGGYLGIARQHSDGSWRFDNYPAIVINGTSNCPYAVNIAGC